MSTKLKIPPNHLYEIIRYPDQPSLVEVYGSNYSYNQTHGSDSFQGGQKILTFRNVIIEDDIIFNSTTKANAILFENVSFKKITFGEIDPDRTPDKYLDFIFSTCEISEVDIFQGKYHPHIYFENTVSLESVNLYTTVLSLSISNSAPKSQQSLLNFSLDRSIHDTTAAPLKGNITITGLKTNKVWLNLVNASFRMNECECEILEFSGRGFSEIEIGDSLIANVRITDLSGKLTIKESSIGELLLQGDDHEASGQIDISKSSINFFNFNFQAAIQRLSISDNSKIEYIGFFSAAINVALIESTTIGYIDFDFSFLRLTSLKIAGSSKEPSHVNTLIFRDGIFATDKSGKKSEIFLQGITVSSILFRSFINQANFYISNITAKSPVKLDIPEFCKKRSAIISHNYEIFNPLPAEHLFMRDSDLGKINFVTCRFSSLVMELSGSKINEIYLSETEMPHSFSGDSQFGYYQLKKLFEGQGDSVQALRYQALELNAHLRVLNKQKFRFGSNGWMELWTLRVNKISNEFGTNWGKAFLCIFVSSILLFSLYAFSLGYTPASPLDVTKRGNFLKIFPFYFEFLFPLHKADFIPEALSLKANGFSRFLDFLSRIVLGYFFYQFIQAFRKFGKK